MHDAASTLALEARLPCFPHQLSELTEHWDSPSRALLWQMRTGKTKCVLDNVFLLQRFGGLATLLVVAPPGVHVNWVHELAKHAWEPGLWKHVVWRSGETDADRAVEGLRRSTAPVLVSVNYEALLLDRVQRMLRVALARGPCMLAVDESHHVQRPIGKISRLVRKLARRCAWRRILTGTPAENTPLAAWAQYEVLEPGALGHRTFGSFEGWQARYLQKRGGGGRFYKQLDEANPYPNIPELHGAMAPYTSWVKRSDVEGLPPLLRSERRLVLTDAQRRAYETLRKEYILELGSGRTLTALEAGARVTKLQQVASGWVRRNDGGYEVFVDPAACPRVDACLDEMRGAGGPCVVWCRFTEDIRRVCLAAGAAGMACVTLYGEMPRGAREGALARFRGQAGGPIHIVAQPQVGGEGIDLGAASTVIWYSHTYDATVRAQADERCTRVSGRSTSVVDLVADRTVDERILALLAQKRRVADMLADVLSGDFA